MARAKRPTFAGTAQSLFTAYTSSTPGPANLDFRANASYDMVRGRHALGVMRGVTRVVTTILSQVHRMGLYDREYARDDQRGIFLGGERMMVTNLVFINVGVYVIQIFSGGKGSTFEELFALSDGVFQQPWHLYQLVTYGFLHLTEANGALSFNSLAHIGFNMYGLWFFGRDVEQTYGRRNFLWLYLTTVIIGGLVWAAAELTQAGNPYLVGASGGVMGVIALYILNFPHRTLLIWGVWPVKAWVLGVVFIAIDLLHLGDQESTVAVTAHLGGAVYGFFYFRTGWSLGKIVPGGNWLDRLKPKPRLKVHDPDEYEEAMSEQVDEILRKIQTHGQDSLTAKERRTLEKASRRYQQKHR